MNMNTKHFQQNAAGLHHSAANEISVLEMAGALHPPQSLFLSGLIPSGKINQLKRRILKKSGFLVFDNTA